MPNTEPTTTAGKAMSAEQIDCIDLDGYGYVLPDDWNDRIAAIEAQAAERAVKPWREKVAAVLPALVRSGVGTGVRDGHAYVDGPALTAELARLLSTPTGGDTE